MKISLVCSTRDNLQYLKWSYKSVRKNQGNHEVWMCYGVDHCTDGTLEWIQEIQKNDPFVKYIVNETGQRLGHTIMYDKIVYELVETDLAMIWHSDMYLCEGALDSIESLIRPNTIVSLTRIEPPLHPSGPEKIVMDFGTEPENFDEVTLIEFVKKQPKKQPTKGVFAPWAFWVDEFKSIGGHDFLFSPQSKEDSDIFNRFKLSGVDFKQTWEGFVYHLTCRGSRYNPNLTTIGQNSGEWEMQNIRSARNFIRKWGSMVQHTAELEPIIPNKYNIGFVVYNPTYQILYSLEPFCDVITLVGDNKNVIDAIIKRYIYAEQPNTKYDLSLRVRDKIGKLPDIIVTLDGNTINPTDMNYLMNLPVIIADSGEVGEFQLGNLRLNIGRLDTYQNDLINVNNQNINLKVIKI